MHRAAAGTSGSVWLVDKMSIHWLVKKKKSCTLFFSLSVGSGRIKNQSPGLVEDVDSISESYVPSNCRNSAADIFEGEGILAVMFRIDDTIYVSRIDVNCLGGYRGVLQ